MNLSRYCAAVAVSLLLLPSCITGDEKPSSVPVSLYGATSGPGSVGIHTVSSGETLWKISQRYRLSMRDIIQENNLNAPYVLAVGQRLKLPPPREYTVKSGDTLYGVSRLFNASVNDVARLNNLRSPYALKTGQIIRLPSPAGAEQLQAPQAGGSDQVQASVNRDTSVIAEPLAAPVPGRRPEAVLLGQVRSGDASEASVQSSPVISAQDGKSAAAPRTPITKAPPVRSGSKFKWPVNGPVLSAYGPKKDGLHNDGINIRAPKGAPVRAAENGVVVYAGSELQGYGNLVLIRHQDRWVTAYAHLDKIMVERAQTVNVGETIGTVGSSGSVDSPQLHFEVRRGTEALNPKRYLE